ncbi:fumarylacetoacetate hydrolase family protein [Methylobacterium sp. E-041]|uniref:fumarylacetoacetate hydrolase family protein n=1 Tax=unclassified Methylobacterium TaxID=2615210 RepID=UPI0011CA13A0|nr:MULTISPECIES: fumarylacetoacetate hydrolase family protein [unclassified Methylobacterium]MCJ2041047.1 fumarylacetoacetate hydrolase family protein [Methylobacterium sp. J-059]MCJ2078019.1 fumarylacetoacetate hydrolase family protein [Methylobacterium sp. E-016]MCJ2105308.1 fumarylacetoacetate hydrolase family protein [Methylobacterium sp. E-041]MCJ2112708.1 fumarylacetoacetate hydrolase family protein [Methylobacterium sp. E-025]TXM93327.1 2-keto-4-pentenoate hydratase [Methylobacterium sp
MSTRRDFLHLTAAATAVGALVGSASAQAPASGPGHPIPPPSGEALRLVTFAPDAGSTPRLGVVRSDGRVVDLTQVGVPGVDPAQMVSLITAGPAALDAVRRAAAAGDGPQVETVRLLAPIPAPTRNIYAVGWNYLEHFAEGQAVRGTNAEYPAHPVFFTKGVNTINGPYDPIPYDASVSTAIDWEVELAVIIGTGGRNITEADAMAHVFGYSVINDTTARDMQIKLHGGQWFKGKSLDGYGPIGPWIVPASDLDPSNLRLLTRVNGVVKQDASTAQMYFKVARIIAELSHGLTLVPGDIIATGTPPGIGNARKPPEFLKPGDVMETEIVGLGTLRNVIQAVPA